MFRPNKDIASFSIKQTLRRRYEGNSEAVGKYPSYRISPRQVFDDWLDLMLFALMHKEEKYMALVKTYENERYKKGKRPTDYFAKAFGLLMKEMKRTNENVLGEIYMNWNLTNKLTGQYFTPPAIAKFMAMLLMPKGEYISDPCCGSGVLLIEASKTMTYEHLNKALFIGQEIDYTCVRMSALNLLCFNLNSYVIHGNTLFYEYRRIFQTSRSVYGGSIRELSENEVEAMRPNLEKIVKQKETDQLSFF